MKRKGKLHRLETNTKGVSKVMEKHNHGTLGHSKISRQLITNARNKFYETEQ
jgi:hypothetical protein